MLLLLLVTTSLSAATMAINVLFTLDDATREWAEKINKTLHQKNPKSYRFDDSHLAHVSLFQSYVEITCLDEKWEAIEKEIKASKLIGETLPIKNKSAEPLPQQESFAVATVSLGSSPKLLQLQKKMSEILAPCRSEVENPKAFYGTVPLGHYTLSLVKNFSSFHMGEKYTPRLELGISAVSDIVTALSAVNSSEMVLIKRIGVFRSGLHATARERLFSFD